MEHSRSERPLVMRNFGYKDRDAFLAYMGQMLNATSTSRGEELDALSLKFLIGFVEDFGPQNQIEAAAAMQMATLHQHAMGFAHRASMADNALERELNERHFIKCSRTYMDFMAATKIFRNTSQPGGHGSEFCQGRSGHRRRQHYHKQRTLCRAEHNRRRARPKAARQEAEAHARQARTARQG